MRIILDAAHGIEVAGKRSPDGTLREYKWSREIIARISGILEERNIDYALTVEGDNEPGLKERVRRTNKLSEAVAGAAIFLSIHCNAAGMGQWMNARGFSIWTTRGKTRADGISNIIFEEFVKEFPELQTRADWSDGDADYESNFAVLMCRIPAVLIEVLFQDNKEDVEILQSEDFKTRFVDMMIRAIEKIISN